MFRFPSRLPAIVLAATLPCARTAIAQNETPLEKMCWVLDRIDTPADHTGGDGQGGWRAGHRVVTNGDGSQTATRTGVGMRYVGSSWRFWPAEGRATYTQPGGTGSGSATWTVFPRTLCYGATLPLTIRVSAQGAAAVVASYTEPANWLDYKYQEPRWKDPMQGVRAEKGEGFGTVSAKFTPHNRQEFQLAIRLDDDAYTLEIHYHYRPLKAGEQPPEPQPPKPKCDKTFAKTWAKTTWGTVAFTLSGNVASGTYTNRGLKFGPGTITGTVSGDVLTGTWADASGAVGAITITMAADGCTITGTSTSPGTPEPPPPLGPEPPLPPQPPQPQPPEPPFPPPPTPIDLTGYWVSDTGFLHFLRQIGDKLYWEVDALPKARNVLVGTIVGMTITSTWVDLPGGLDLGSGSMTLKIDSNDHLTKLASTPGYAASTWTRVGTVAGPVVPFPPMPPITPPLPPPVTPPVTGGNPWETPRGQACIEQWISVATAKLNAHDGGATFNGLKPWGIDPKYGTLTNRKTGPSRAPDNFPAFQNNRYAYIWANYQTDASGMWGRPEWNASKVPSVSAYVLDCQSK